MEIYRALQLEHQQLLQQQPKRQGQMPSPMNAAGMQRAGNARDNSFSPSLMEDDVLMGEFYLADGIAEPDLILQNDGVMLM